MRILCEVCDVTCSDYYGWTKHLLTKEHQEVAEQSIHSCSSNMAERTIVATNLGGGITGKLLHPEVVMDYFANLGLIHDFYIRWHDSPNEDRIKGCVVLMDSKAVTDSFLLGGQEIPGVVGSFMKRRDMSQKTWNALIGNPEVALFQNRHKMLKNMWKEKSLTLDEQLDEFIREMSLSQLGLEKRQQFLDELEGLIRKEFSSCRLQPFGSFYTGIGGDDADVDIFVDIRDPSNLDPMSAFNRTVRRLRIANVRRIFNKFIPIPSARIPIIKLVHAVTDVEADISFTSGISTHNSKLIKFFIDFDPRVRPLLLIIRYWGRYHNLIGSDKFKTYSLVLMAVVFLNHQRIIPSVHYIQNLGGVEPHIINSCNVAFAGEVSLVRQKISEINAQFAEIMENAAKQVTYEAEVVLQLAKGFFKMYAELNFEQNILCPLVGSPICKSELKNESKAPPEIPWEKILKLSFKNVCVQDPFALDYNVTGNVRWDMLRKFQSLCRITAEKLEEKLCQINNEDTTFELMELFFDVTASSVDIHKKDPISASKVPTTTDESNAPLPDESDTIIHSQAPASPVEKMENPIVLTDEKQNSNFRSVNLMFKINKDFSNTFMMIADSFSEEIELKLRMKILWVSFVHDFLMNIWDKAYGFHSPVGLRTTKIQKLPEVPRTQDLIGVDETTTDFNFNDVYVLPHAVEQMNIKRGNELDQGTLERPSSAISNPSLESKKRKHVSSSENPEDVFQNQVHDVDSKVLKIRRENGFVMSNGNIFDTCVDLLQHGKKQNFHDDIEINPLAESLQTFSSPGSEESTEIQSRVHSIAPLPRDQQYNKTQYAKIHTGLRKPFCNRYFLYSDAKNWVGRDNEWLKRLEMMQKYHKELWENPIQQEECVTKVLVNANKDMNTGKMVKFECTASVWTDVDPILLFNLKETIDDTENQISAIDLITSNFRIIVPQYLQYRLFKHFRI